MAKTNGSAAIVPSKSEVLDAAAVVAGDEAKLTKAQQTAQALAELEVMNGDMEAKLKAVMAAKAESFTDDPDKDYWKAENPGDALKGIYLGNVQKGRYLVHALATTDSKGKPMAVRFNGTHGLTAALKRTLPGTGILIVFEGETKTEEGMRFKKYSVKTLNG